MSILTTTQASSQKLKNLWKELKHDEQEMKTRERYWKVEDNGERTEHQPITGVWDDASSGTTEV